MTRTWNGPESPARESGPENFAATKPLRLTTQSTGRTDETVGEQLRRRRAAAARCAPLGDGRRDPAQRRPRDGVATQTLHVLVGPRHTAWLIGGRVPSLLRHLDVPTQFDHAKRLWSIPVNRVDDVLAYAEHAEHRFVTVEAVDR